MGQRAVVESRGLMYKLCESGELEAAKKAEIISPDESVIYLFPWPLSLLPEFIGGQLPEQVIHQNLPDFKSRSIKFIPGVQKYVPYHTTPPTLTTVTENSVAAQLVANGRSQNRRRPTGEYRRTAVPDHPQPARALTKPFDPQELEAAMSMLKPGKAAEIDDVLAEMIHHLGPKAKTWLLEMLNSCMEEKIIPPV
ncbi:unnamed protein product [Leuciscus chuanchicus]